MNITLKINGTDHNIDTAPSITLLSACAGLTFTGSSLMMKVSILTLEP